MASGKKALHRTRTTQARIEGPAAFIGVTGDGIISFGSGQPDLPPPDDVFTTLTDRRLFKYGLVQGNLDLRTALAHEYPAARPDQFVITNGASEALDLVFRAIRQLHGRTKVLLCRPYYYSYPPLVTLAGLTPVYTNLIEGRIDLADFTRKLTGVKAVLINSPSNPTGRVEAIPTLKAIEKLCRERGIYVISDEVYKDLIYERANYLIKGPHVVTVNSFSKTFSLCGLRVGYLYARDPALVREVTEIKSHTSMNTNVLAQEMALRALRVPRALIRDQTAIWKERRDTLYSGLQTLGFNLWKPEGAFYVLPRIKHGAQVVNDLYHDYRVIVYDGAWFGAPGRIRLSYALSIESMQEGLARIKTYLKGKESWLR